MPSDKPTRRLEDIIENARAIQHYVTGMDMTAFAKDQKTYDAVERCLERISEAAAKLGDLASTLVPNQPWQESTTPFGKIGFGTSCKSICRRCAPSVRKLYSGCVPSRQRLDEKERQKLIIQPFTRAAHPAGRDRNVDLLPHQHRACI